MTSDLFQTISGHLVIRMHQAVKWFYCVLLPFGWKIFANLGFVGRSSHGYRFSGQPGPVCICFVVSDMWIATSNKRLRTCVVLAEKKYIQIRVGSQWFTTQLVHMDPNSRNATETTVFADRMGLGCASGMNGFW